CHARGSQVLKGVSTPVPVYRVLRESEAQSRFEVAVRTGLTPLVGRAEELGLLRRRWEQAKAGEGQGVLLVSVHRANSTHPWEASSWLAAAVMGAVLLYTEPGNNGWDNRARGDLVGGK